jgi:hypothetical protein
MRSKYGEKLREFLLKQNIKSIVDFGDLPVFEEATTYPCILEIAKGKGGSYFKSAEVEKLSFDKGLGDYLIEILFEVDSRLLQSSGWTLTNVKVQNLLEKLRNQGIPLKEYVNGKIYRGVLTGLNEAFVIDEDTREKLNAEDANSAEVIKPFLAGREIKRYKEPKPKNHLILFKNGYTKQFFGEITEEKAFDLMSEKYPAVMTYLKQFEEKAKKRWDKGNFWWELRACVYYDQFEKKKVMLPDIALKTQALIDHNNSYCANTAYIIPDLAEYHLGLLNSKLLLFFYSNLTQTISGGYFRFIRQYLEQLPIKDAPAEIENEIINLVNCRIDGDIEAESHIDQLVYQLYGLTEEEIQIIEQS